MHWHDPALCWSWLALVFFGRSWEPSGWPNCRQSYSWPLDLQCEWRLALCLVASKLFLVLAPPLACWTACWRWMNQPTRLFPLTLGWLKGVSAGPSSTHAHFLLHLSTCSVHNFITWKLFCNWKHFTICPAKDEVVCSFFGSQLTGLQVTRSWFWNIATVGQLWAPETGCRLDQFVNGCNGGTLDTCTYTFLDICDSFIRTHQLTLYFWVCFRIIGPWTDCLMWLGRKDVQFEAPCIPWSKIGFPGGFGPWIKKLQRSFTAFWPKSCSRSCF